MSEPPTPTRRFDAQDGELQRWSRIFAGDRYYYGADPGPVARRAVRYHRPFLPWGGRALDAGCGEGQDLAFLAEMGYEATGIEFTPQGAEKARRLLTSRGLTATVVECDLRAPDIEGPFDLVLAVNSIQFMGKDAETCLRRLMEMVAPGGVIGLSLFGRDPGEADISGTLWLVTLEELLHRFVEWQPLEAANLWQWNTATNEPQSFVTLIARKAPAVGQGLISL